MPAAGVDPSREPSDPTGAEAPDSTDHRHRRRSQPDRLPAGRPDADKQQGDARPGCFPSGELPGGSACVEQRLGPESRTASQHHPTRGYQRRHTALRFQREDVIPVHAARVIAAWNGHPWNHWTPEQAWSDHRTPTRRGSARPDLAQLELQAGKLGASLQVFDAFESL